MAVDLTPFNPFISPDKGAFGAKGIIFFFNNILRIVFLVAGIYAFVNFFIAGFQYVNAGGDPKKIEAAGNKIWHSIVGIIIMVVSFIGAVVVGQLLFGDPGALLNIKIFGPGSI